MDSAHNGSVYSEYSQDEAFSFGMNPFNEFDSDSDSEADNTFVDINAGGHGDVNEQFMAEMAQLNTYNDDGKAMKIHTILIICLHSRRVATMYITRCNLKVSPSIHVLPTSDFKLY